MRLAGLPKYLNNIYVYTGWPKKVSHYEVSSLNRIINRH